MQAMCSGQATTLWNGYSAMGAVFNGSFDWDMALKRHSWEWWTCLVISSYITGQKTTWRALYNIAVAPWCAVCRFSISLFVKFCGITICGSLSSKQYVIMLSTSVNLSFTLKKSFMSVSSIVIFGAKFSDLIL